MTKLILAASVAATIALTACGEYTPTSSKYVYHGDGGSSSSESETGEKTAQDAVDATYGNKRDGGQVSQVSYTNDTTVAAAGTGTGQEAGDDAPTRTVTQDATQPEKATEDETSTNGGNTGVDIF